MSWNLFERLAVWSINRVWGGGVRGAPPEEDLVLFVGAPTDVDDRPTPEHPQQQPDGCPAPGGRVHARERQVERS